MAPKGKSLKQVGDVSGSKREQSNERRETGRGGLGSGAVTEGGMGTVTIEGMGSAASKDATAPPATLGRDPEACN